MASDRPFDHGELNIPLAKRGNIDAQIDRYKVARANDEAAQHRATFHSVRAKKARVKQLLDSISDDRVMAMAALMGKRTAKTARAALTSVASSNLDRWITALEREVH